MKLLVFIHDLSKGGAERVTTNLANYWARQGRDVTVVTLAGGQDAYVLHPAVKRVSLGLITKKSSLLFRLFPNARYVVLLRRVLRQIRPDVALGMMSMANILLAFSGRGLSFLRTIGVEHNHPPLEKSTYRWAMLRRYGYGLLHAVVVLTRESQDWIRCNTKARRVAVISNAVTWPLPAEKSLMNPQKHCQPERKILLAAGRLVVEKGFDWLIESFRGCALKHPDWDLVILGEGPLRSELEMHVQKFGLEKRIFLPGEVGNMGDWYERADLYTMSSRSEGFPLVLLEAMSYGLAAVSFDCDTGPRDIIRHEIDGLLVPAGNVTKLTAALDLLMSDASLRERFAQRAVEVRERFSFEKVAGEWEQLFEAVQ